MNISVLRSMVHDGDLSEAALKYMLGCRAECEHLDFKEELHLNVDKVQCDISKDMLAMKNVGGGYIVVGVRDKDWSPVGLPDDWQYDTKQLRDILRKCSGVDLDIFLADHKVAVEGKLLRFACILVRSSRRRRIPTLVKNNYRHTHPYGLRAGEIYARKGDSTIRTSTEEELLTLIDDIDNNADVDALTLGTRRSPFAVEDGLFRLLERGFETFVGRDDL